VAAVTASRLSTLTTAGRLRSGRGGARSSPLLAELEQGRAELLDAEPGDELPGVGGAEVLGSRRAGTSIRYRITDPCVIALLDQGLCLSEDAGTRRPVASPVAIGPPSP